jgi:adenine-specific DNA-methyltransferase
MFEDANIDVLIFRYCKNKLKVKQVLYNDRLLYITNSNGLITFSEEQTISRDSSDSGECSDGTSGCGSDSIMFQEYFDIYVGLVSGKEEVFKNEELGNIEVLNGDGKVNKYIYIKSYPCKDDKINTHLLHHKNTLIERGIRKFNEYNWFEWGAPRNITTINDNIGKDCIYIYNLTRRPNVAFLGKVMYFGGGLIMLKPKKDCDLNNIVSYMNSNKFKENFMFSGRFKIGHRQISNSYIPSAYL